MESERQRGITKESRCKSWRKEVEQVNDRENTSEMLEGLKSVC